MDGAGTSPSPQLVEANRQLLARRQQAAAQRSSAAIAADLPWVSDSSARQAPTAVCASVVAAAAAELPAHLGWGSQAATAVARRPPPPPTLSEVESEAERQQTVGTSVMPPLPAQDKPQPLAGAGTAPIATELAPDWVKLYPDIGLGMLRQELAAPGRLWLLLRYLDREGRGLLRIDNIASTLNTPSSPLHFCGKRQLRNLLRDGEGIFWVRGKGCLWLRSAARVASGLGVVRLTGQPVALPLAALLGGIGDFRAHLYTAFYSGRTKESAYGIEARPMARDTLAGLSGVGRSSQRAYETRVGVAVQANFAVGELSSKEGKEKRAWQQGQALFEIKDYRGQQGKRGRTYLAWQLPNSYVGQHQRRPKGRQKRINRELKDLVTKGTPGNVGGTGEMASLHGTGQLQKRYYPYGKLAAMAYGRHPDQPHYWRWQGTRHGRFVMWQQVGA